MEDRNLTEEDIQALAEALECRLINRFYKNIGRGLLSLAWKGAVMALMALAAYGATKGKGWW